MLLLGIAKLLVAWTIVGLGLTALARLEEVDGAGAEATRLGPLPRKDAAA